MMRGDLNVNILYWKVWRSRDVVMENTKDLDVIVYVKFLDYFNKLVKFNLGFFVEFCIEL